MKKNIQTKPSQDTNQQSPSHRDSFTPSPLVSSAVQNRSGTDGQEGSPTPAHRGKGILPGQLTYVEGEEVRRGYVELLGRYPWDFFATLTFAKARRDPFEACKVFDIWLKGWVTQEAELQGLMTSRKIEVKDGYGRNLSPKTIRRGWFWNQWRKKKQRPIYALGVEKHKYEREGCVHLHAVVRFPQAIDYPMAKRGWKKWWGPKDEGGLNLGFARIELPNSQEDVLGYCSKYVVKESQEGGMLILSDSFNAARITPTSGMISSN